MFPFFKLINGDSLLLKTMEIVAERKKAKKEKQLAEWSHKMHSGSALQDLLNGNRIFLKRAKER